MATTYLSRTPGSTGNVYTGTLSVWVKRANIGAEGFLFYAFQDASNRTRINFQPGDQLYFNTVVSSSNDYELTTNRLFRDPSGWYHIVVAFDTTQGVAADRLKLYVNGVQETFTSSSYPSENQSMFINESGSVNYIASQIAGNYFAGVMSHFYWIDGTAYAPTVFGSTDATTGEWVINTDPTVTMGTNGFLIMKDGNTITDQSANSNDFTLVAGTLTNTEDCPSDVFSTFNPLLTSSYTTLSGGNNTSLGNTASDSGNTCSTLVPNKGKFYCEIKITNKSGTGYPRVGFGQASDDNFGRSINANAGMAGYNTAYSASLRPDGQRYTNNTTSSWTSTTFDDGDFIMLAMDCDNGAGYIGKNDVWMESGDPTSGASKTGALVTWTPSSHTQGQAFYVGDYDASKTEWNFGNGYFGTTIISSAGTNASNIGIFEYDVPTGYTALSTKGLQE